MIDEKMLLAALESIREGANGLASLVGSLIDACNAVGAAVSGAAAIEWTDMCDDPVCGDCPDYEIINGEVGHCEVIRGSLSADSDPCPPRRRELEALAEVERLRNALLPFSKATKGFTEPRPDNMAISVETAMELAFEVTVADLRAARQAMDTPEEAGDARNRADAVSQKIHTGRVQMIPGDPMRTPCPPLRSDNEGD